MTGRDSIDAIRGSLPRRKPEVEVDGWMIGWLVQMSSFVAVAVALPRETSGVGYLVGYHSWDGDVGE